jgi:hypothetical protein
MSEKNIVCRVTISSVAKMGSPAAQPVLQYELEYAECRVNSEQNNTLQACHPAFDERRNRQDQHNAEHDRNIYNEGCVISADLLAVRQIEGR